MNRPALMVALLLATAAHAWLLWGPAHRTQTEAQVRADTGDTAAPLPVQVIERALAEPPIPPSAHPTPQASDPSPHPSPPPAALEPDHQPLEADPSTQTQSAPRGASRSTAPEQPSTEPQLYIDWGSNTRAIDMLQQTGMKLVVLEPPSADTATTPRIRWELVHHAANPVGSAGSGWQLQPIQPAGRIRYSNRLRIVDDVPAFAEPATHPKLEPDDRLAVLVPRQVEQLMQRAQLAAASQAGLTLNEVDYFLGRFTDNAGSVSFEISDLKPRSNPHGPAAGATPSR